jgi:hypothetical protein
MWQEIAPLGYLPIVSMSGARPRVSVVMSVRNAERFVAQAVESILAQTTTDLELLVVDNASSDGTPRILSTLARGDARLRLHRLGPDAGLAAALNFACEQAQGPLIARMDGDDVASPDRLERQAAFLDAHGSVALVGGAATVIDDSGQARRTLRPPTDDARIRSSLVERNCIIHSTVTMRRDALRRLGGYRAGFVHAEDYDLWLRLAERHPLANLPEVVLQYRVHPEQVSHQALEQQVLSTLAARAAARRRRAGIDEGSVGEKSVARSDLAALGIAEDAVQSALATAYLHRAADLGDVDRPRLAAAALARTPDFAVSAEVRRRTLARYHALLARRRWSRGQVARSLVSALRAVRARPALLGHLVRALIRPARDRATP